MGTGQRVTEGKTLTKRPTSRKGSGRIRQREIDKAEDLIDAKVERILNGRTEKVVVDDEETGAATMYKLMPKVGTKSDVELATEAVEHFESLGYTSVSVQGSPRDAGRNWEFVLRGDSPDIEEEVVPMRDHDGEVIYMKVQHRFESEIGPAIRGFAYSDPAVLNKQYLGARVLPVANIYDAAAEKAEKAAKRSTSRSARKAGGGHCHHCGEPTKGGRFIPGHDAKLKGDLIREATVEAEAERIIRKWTYEPEKMSGKLASLVAEGDAFIRSRVIERTGLSEEELF